MRTTSVPIIYEVFRIYFCMYAAVQQQFWLQRRRGHPCVRAEDTAVAWYIFRCGLFDVRVLAQQSCRKPKHTH